MSLFETERYEVRPATNVMGEDGNYGREGYAVVNKETGVEELTTTVLPSAIYHATHFNDMLEGLLNPPAENEVLSEMTFPDDVVPN